MNKTISTILGILIVVLVAGAAGASVLFFNQGSEEIILLEEGETVQKDGFDLEKKEEVERDLEKEYNSDVDTEKKVFIKDEEKFTQKVMVKDIYLEIKGEFDKIEKPEELESFYFNHGSKSLIKEFEKTKDDIYENFETYLLLIKKSPKKESIKNIIEESISDYEVTLKIRTENPVYNGETRMIFENEEWKFASETWTPIKDVTIKNRLSQLRIFAESLFMFESKYEDFREASAGFGEKAENFNFLIVSISDLTREDVNIYFSKESDSYCMYTILIEKPEEFFCVDSFGQILTVEKKDLKCNEENISCK
jgi:glucan-binding YG repeat protein